MAVIGRRSFCLRAAFLTAAGPLLHGFEESQLRFQVGALANALSAGDPSDAMTYFSKSLRDYDKLRDYFTGLTGAFTIRNEVDVLEEQDTANQLVATLRWAITLSDAQTGESRHRAAEIHVRFVREKSKWKIAEFAPIEIFNPAKV